MDTAAFDKAVSDHAAAVLLRYFSATQSLSFGHPSLVLRRDRELLRLHWSLSTPVSRLVTYVLENRHEVQSVLSNIVRIEDGTLRGRLDAFATVKLRQVSGLPTAIVSHEPVRSFSSGPNQLLGWVIMEAWSLASRFSTITLDSSGYQMRLHHARQQLDQCRRLQGIAQIAGQTILNRRPAAAAIAEASRSRRKVYQLATEAYRHLLAIEEGKPDVLAALLQDTLVGPLEPWRRFELAIGMSIAEALAAVQSVSLDLNLMVGDKRRSLARSGRFAVFWQSATEHYRAPPLEPSEIVERRILAAYGIAAGSDRPDLVVIDQIKKEVVAIVEVKYLTSEDATDRVRSAVSQIVRYARGYTELGSADALLGNCIAVMSGGIENIVQPNMQPGLPAVMDFASINSGRLTKWAAQLLQ